MLWCRWIWPAQRQQVCLISPGRVAALPVACAHALARWMSSKIVKAEELVNPRRCAMKQRLPGIPPSISEDWPAHAACVHGCSISMRAALAQGHLGSASEKRVSCLQSCLTACEGRVLATARQPGRTFCVQHAHSLGKKACTACLWQCTPSWGNKDPSVCV